MKMTFDEAIRERLAKILALQEEVSVLKRAKPILEGKVSGPARATGKGERDRRFKAQPNSDASLAAKAIREAKKPLGIPDILEYLSKNKKGKKSNKNSVVSVLAKMAKHGKVFYRCVQPSTFGLLEWPEKPDMREG